MDRKPYTEGTAVLERTSPSESESGIPGKADGRAGLVPEHLDKRRCSRRLERKGYLVITAQDGEQRYSLAHSGNPDLILMDIGLPAMDGWQVTQLLKASNATRHIPIIILTAGALIGDQAKASEMGCSDYQTKPVEFARLSQKIEKLLPENRPA